MGWRRRERGRELSLLFWAEGEERELCLLFWAEGEERAREREPLLVRLFRLFFSLSLFLSFSSGLEEKREKREKRALSSLLGWRRRERALSSLLG